jgi:hypothetical protein
MNWYVFVGTALFYLKSFKLIKTKICSKVGYSSLVHLSRTFLIQVKLIFDLMRNFKPSQVYTEEKYVKKSSYKAERFAYFKSLFILS